MNIVLLGAPGSGKGTQAEYIAEEFKLHYFQSGKLARELAAADPRIAKIINSGKLIPEGLMTSYVMKVLEEKYPDGKNILFEGWPRFVTQYEDLKNWLKERGEKIDKVVSLDVSEEIAVARISSRRICDKCGEVYNLVTNPPPSENTCACGGTLVQREDDFPEAIKVRFEYYRDNTQKLIDYADSRGELIRIDGEQPIEEINSQIKEALTKIYG